MVDLDVWEAAKGVAGERARAARAAAAAAEREAAVRGELAAKLAAQVGARAACLAEQRHAKGLYLFTFTTLGLLCAVAAATNRGAAEHTRQRAWLGETGPGTWGAMAPSLILVLRTVTLERRLSGGSRAGGGRGSAWRRVGGRPRGRRGRGAAAAGRRRRPGAQRGRGRGARLRGSGALAGRARRRCSRARHRLTACPRSPRAARATE